MRYLKLILTALLLVITCPFGVQAEAMHKVTIKKGLSLKEQLTKENTIYIIKSDFDLKGEIITIPKGSTLKFKKGVLTNGVLLGQDTEISTRKKKRFGRGLIVKGTWDVDNVYSEWFGCNADGADDTESLKAFFNFPAPKKTLKAGTYGVNELLCDQLKNCDIYAYGATLKYLRTDLDNIPGDHAVLANYNGTIQNEADMNGYLHLYGLTIDGNSQNFVYEHNPKVKTPIINHNTLHLVLTDEVLLKDCTFKNSFMTAVMLDVCKKSVIESCNVLNSGESINYKPVGVWYTWEGVCVMDKVYTNKGWRTEPCESCVVRDSYFENIGGSFASANCRVFDCYGNTVKDNRGYAFELSSGYIERQVIIHDNEFFGVGSAILDMSHFDLPDDGTSTIIINNNKFYNLGYDSKRKQPCAKAFLIIYRNKGKNGTGILDMTVKNNLLEFAPLASQGLIKCDHFVFEDNVCKGFNGNQNSALFFCGNDEGKGSYYIKSNTLNLEGGAVSIIRNPKYLEVSGNVVNTSRANSIIWVQGTDSIMEQAVFSIHDNEVNGVSAMAYVSTSPKELKLYDNKSESIEVGISRSSSDVRVNCTFGKNSFKRVSGTLANIKLTEYGK